MFNKIGDIKTDLTKQDTSSWTCPQCGAVDDTQYFLKIIFSGRKDEFFPRYLPQIKESCSVCGRYRRFVKHTDMLITRLNERLEKIPVKARGFRDGV